MKIFGNSYVFRLFSYFLYFYTTGASQVVHVTVSVREGESADLPCELPETGGLVEQVAWQKRTRGNPRNRNFMVIIPPKDVRYVANDGLRHRVLFTGNLTKKSGSIQLLDVSLEDEGVYTCNLMVSPHQMEIRLDVLIPPVVTVMPAAPLVVGGGSGILVTCIAANGRPGAGVSWRTDQVDGPTEINNNVTHNPNGTTTIMSNLLVTPTRSMHDREVQCVVNHTALKHDEIVPYRISVHYAPQSVNITLNETSSEGPAIHCNVDANPAPTRYTWRVNNEELGPLLRQEGSRLVFLKKDSDLNGPYVCEAVNQYGRLSRTLFVFTGVSRSYYGGLLAVIFIFCLLVLLCFYASKTQLDSP